MNPASVYLLQVVLNWSHVLAPAVPLAVVAVRTTRPDRLRNLWLLPALFLLEMACVLSPRAPFLPAGWNWQGKFLECLWVLAFVATGYAGNYADFGFRRRLAAGAGRPLLLAAALGLCFPIFGLFVAGFRMPTDVETFLFELTMPGLAEELVFRGVFQSLLNQVFGRPWRLLGTQVGWGYVLTTLLFTAAHGIFVNRALHPQFSAFSMLPGLYAGLILGWMRERGESLWPCVLLHNSMDTALVVGSALLS